MTKLTRKQLAWLIPRLLVLGPLALIIILGEWAEDAFNYLDNVMPPEGKDAN